MVVQQEVGIHSRMAVQMSEAALSLTPEEKLWRSVVRQAVHDRLAEFDKEPIDPDNWKHRRYARGAQPSGPKQENGGPLATATFFLFHDPEFPVVCQAGRLDPNMVRESLKLAERYIVERGIRTAGAEFEEVVNHIIEVSA